MSSTFAAQRTWRRCATAAGIATAALYLFAFRYLLNWEKDEECALDHQTWFDADYHGSQGYWPLSNKCNAHFEIVPVWVNPTIAALAGGTALFLIAVGATAWQQRRSGGRRAGERPERASTLDGS